MIQFKNLKKILLFTTITLYSSSTAQNNSCESYARCGAFGACNAQASPICKCLHGFGPFNGQEWNSGNWTRGCFRRVPLNCETNGTVRNRDEFLRIRMVKVPGYSQHLFGPEARCPGLCLLNCSCIAYAHDNDLGCMFWNSTLFDIQKFHSGLSSDLYFRVANSELDHNKHLKKIIEASVITSLLIISICMFFSWKWMLKRRVRKRASSNGKDGTSEAVDSSLQEELSKFNLEDLPLFQVQILANATDNFSDANKLGKGGFGPVHKGVLDNGREIAVKRLSRASGQGMQEFMNEIVLISKLQHRNLVRLLGCCLEGNEKMLIYEYMPNKSLDFFLFDQSNEILDWRRRFNIIEGICRGLLYLHRDSRLKIIHRDLKPSNILLDNDWNAKISDFGMARIFGGKQDHVRTIRVVGTYGYMAPEYAIEGRFSEKSDVFSLGVLMLEIVSGRKNTSFYNHETSLNLLGHVWNLWIEDKVVASIDERISSPSYRSEVLRCTHIALLCVQELPSDRPSVSAVLSMLSSEIVELPRPKQVAFAPVKSNRGRSSDTGTSSRQSNKSGSSLNSVTLTMLDGR